MKTSKQNIEIVRTTADNMSVEDCNCGGGCTCMI